MTRSPVFARSAIITITRATVVAVTRTTVSAIFARSTVTALTTFSAATAAARKVVAVCIDRGQADLALVVYIFNAHLDDVT